MSKSQKAIRTAREALLRASDRTSIARGELLWTEGYRCGSKSEGAENERLMQKQKRQHEACEHAEQALTRAVAAYARAIRRQKAESV